MKLLLILIIALTCSQGASAFFFGANVALSQSKDLSAAINKYTTLVDKFSPEICQVISVSNKIGRSSFDSAAQRLTDITYLFEDVQVFSSSFLNCLNNQTMNQTAYSSAANIAILIYQLQTRIESGFQDKLGGAAADLGTAFGQPVQDSIVDIADNFVTEFTMVEQYLSVILEDVQAVADAQAEITASDITAEAMTGLVTTCKDIYVTFQQIDTLIANLVIVSKTLDVVITQTQTAQKNTTATMAKASYELDVTVQSANKIFAKSMLTFQSGISEAFAVFQNLSASLFSGDFDVLTSRVEIDNSLAGFFNYVENNIATKFTVISSNFYVQSTYALKDLKDQVDANTQQVVDYFTDLAASSGGAIANCLSPSTTASVTAMKIIQAMGKDSAACLATQQNYSLAAQSLMTFITEDVVLNLQGAADTLCGCSVGGGKKDKDKSKECISNVVKGLPLTIGQDRIYLATEFQAMVQNNAKSQETLLECAATVTTVFDDSFKTLQDTVNACLATGRSGFQR